MKVLTKIFLGLAGLILLPILSSAQNYSIDWYTIDGGGGTSTGGGYTLSGTIGQPDAGTLSGGGYVLEGGFWPGIVLVQTPGSPLLSIFRASGNVQVSWAPSVAGYILQMSDSLVPSHWTNAPTGPTNPALLPANSITRFYRLQHP